jgi:hypothetical protein
MRVRLQKWAAAWIALLLAIAVVAWVEGADTGNSAAPVTASAMTVRLWDTVKPLGKTRRSEWRALNAEAPVRPQGDLVVESGALTIGFDSRAGKVLIYATAEPARTKTELLPAELSGKPARIASTQIVRGEDGSLTVQANFRGAGSKPLPLEFSFTSDRIVAVTRQGKTSGIGILAPVDLAMVPSFVGEDLIFDPKDYPSAKVLCVPSEHLLIGLLRGERGELALTWQDNSSLVRLPVSSAGPGKASITGINVTGGRTLSLSVLDAPSIWHREKLDPSYLERDVAISWKPPFPAMWLSQLYEDEVKTSYEFRDARREWWRGGVGSFTFPTWFSEGKAMLSLSKKIVPEGEAIIYCLERTDRTPEQVLTPVDVVKATLTGDVLAAVLDEQGRKNRPFQRPNAVIGSATCHVTDVMKAIFDAGQEVEKQDQIRGGVEDMYFYLDVMFERNGRFYPFAQGMLAFLDAQMKAEPGLAPYIQEIRDIAAEMITTYDNARDTIRSLDYGHELGRKTVALAAEKRPGNAKRMVELKQAWTGMGGSLEDLARKENTLARKLFQQAGYRAATRPEAAQLAAEIRRRTRKCLENPEAYEIWGNY